MTSLEFPRDLWHEKISPLVIVWCCFRDPMFNRFRTVPACDGQTNRQTEKRTDGHTTTAHTALAQRRAVKNDINFVLYRILSSSSSSSRSRLGQLRLASPNNDLNG